MSSTRKRSISSAWINEAPVPGENSHQPLTAPGLNKSSGRWARAELLCCCWSCPCPGSLNCWHSTGGDGDTGTEGTRNGGAQELCAVPGMSNPAWALPWEWETPSVTASNTALKIQLPSAWTSGSGECHLWHSSRCGVHCSDIARGAQEGIWGQWDRCQQLQFGAVGWCEQERIRGCRSGTGAAGLRGRHSEKPELVFLSLLSSSPQDNKSCCL